MLGFSALAESTIADDAAVEAPSSANQNTNNFAFMLSGPIGALLVGGSRDATINLDPDLDFPPAPSSGNTYISSSNVEYIFTGSKWKVFAKKYNYQGSAPANIANATQLDLSGGNFFDVALTEATTFTFANPPATGFAQKFQVRLNVANQYQDVEENGYDLVTASYDNASFSVAAEEINPTGIFFKPDGTKMYVTGFGSDTVSEYNLSVAWNVSTASYSQNISIASEDGSPQGLFFREDGTKMYTVGNFGDDVNEYNLSVAWDISSLTYVQNFIVATQEDVPTGIFFKPDGTRMFVAGSANDAVNQYDLSTPWNISTASYIQTFSVSAQETVPNGLFFKPDGLSMYVVGVTGDDVNEYVLTVAWDISTASYVRNFSVAAQDLTPNDIYFRPDGVKMYIIGATGDAVYQYTTGSSSANTVPNVTWPASIVWETGSAPTLPELGQTDILEFYTSDSGTTYYGKLKEDNVS